MPRIDDDKPGSIPEHLDRLAKNRATLIAQGRWLRCNEIENGAPVGCAIGGNGWGLELCSSCSTELFDNVRSMMSIVARTQRGEERPGVWFDETKKQ